jgi:hypothetical protein
LTSRPASSTACKSRSRRPSSASLQLKGSLTSAIGMCCASSLPLSHNKPGSELKHEKETILMHFQQLKSQMGKSRGQEREELIALTVKVLSLPYRVRLSHRLSRARPATNSKPKLRQPSKSSDWQRSVASLRPRRRRSFLSMLRQSRRRS